MTYNALLKCIQKMTPKELCQTVKLEEGCSGNVTEIVGMVKARKDMYHENLVPNEGGKAAKDGTEHHWEATEDLKFKKGQFYCIHDH